MMKLIGVRTLKNHLSEVAEIMGVDEDIVWVLPKVKYPNNMIGSTNKLFYDALRALNLCDTKTVLDIPCGVGGVSVYLAKEYGVTVYGYDVMAGFIDNAKEYAHKNNVQHLCHFAVDDIRNVVNKGKEYDALIWKSPPHIWEDCAQTIKNLRKCIKHDGYIFIDDAFLYDEYKDAYPGYETRDEMLKSVTAHGDTIVYYSEEGGEDIYEDGFQFEREAISNAINNSKDSAEIEALERLLKRMDELYISDGETFGGYYMILQINK